MDWVLDCSLALAWALPDETSKQADRFLAGVPRKSVLWVPALWWYEMANALTMAQRRQRLAEADRMRLVELYGMLPIQTDTHLVPDVMWRFHALAQEYGLSAYDAAYLELAQRRGLGLATLDRRLIKAARKAGVKVIRS
ncbi:MAG: type II toxin-antitoxin system VapC family toxin [Nitrospirae bacterium]|nr:type II toxin-antitoxin system VapC family toxin [Nitrospirota bacterium]